MKLSELPSLEFVEVDLDEMLAQSKAVVETLLGRTIERADPIMLLLKAFIALIGQQRLLINELARQNLLAYATGEVLERLGDLVGVERLPASYAVTTLEVKLSTERVTATPIRKGTRVNAGDNVNFATDEDVIFLAGETSATVTATCTEAGEVGNDYGVGELRNVVDPQPFLQSITNLTVTEGGAEVETDESLRERIHTAPESFSVAGSKGAYEYWAKTASALISDVYVESPEPGVVDVYVLEKGGNIPETELLNVVSETLNDRRIRPLTDLVNVKPAVKAEYDIELRYWIARSDATRAIAIQGAVNQAIQEYIDWQREKLGKDISPDEVYYRLRAAGAKRVQMLQPLFLAIDSKSVAIAENISVTYAGLEDD